MYMYMFMLGFVMKDWIVCQFPVLLKNECGNTLTSMILDEL